MAEYYSLPKYKVNSLTQPLGADKYTTQFLLIPSQHSILVLAKSCSFESQRRPDLQNYFHFLSNFFINFRLASCNRLAGSSVLSAR